MLITFKSLAFLEIEIQPRPWIGNKLTGMWLSVYTETSVKKQKLLKYDRMWEAWE